MAETEVKWLKMKVGMFDGNSFKKIKRAKIGGVSYRDKLTAVWFELLDLAGKSNCNGLLVDNNEIPYETYEDIAVMLDREEKEIELCMQFFINEQMVEVVNKIYCITKFIEYQNTDGLEKIKEQKRLAQQRWREKTAKTLLGKTLHDDLCVYCGEKADTIDHIVAKVNGGKDILSNLVPACKRCNCTKGKRDLLTFLNDPFSTFISKELVLSNDKLKVCFNEEKNKYEYVDIYNISTDRLLSISNSTSTSNIYENYNFSDKVKDSIDLWLSYKKERKQTYKDTGLKVLLNRLQKDYDTYGEQYVIDSIESSIASNYQGIFAPKNKEKPKHEEDKCEYNFDSIYAEGTL